MPECQCLCLALKYMYESLYRQKCCKMLSKYIGSKFSFVFTETAISDVRESQVFTGTSINYVIPSVIQQMINTPTL